MESAPRLDAVPLFSTRVAQAGSVLAAVQPLLPIPSPVVSRGSLAANVVSSLSTSNGAVVPGVAVPDESGGWVTVIWTPLSTAE